MRKRTLLIVAPLCVVVLAAGVAVAAPSEQSTVSDAKLDNPHAVRPIAASPSVLELNALSAIFDQAVAFVRDAQAREIGSFLQDAQATRDRRLPRALRGSKLLRRRPAERRQHGSVAVQDNGDFLSCVRWRESRGDYTVHNYQGSGASGAYQFMPGTWNSIAGVRGSFRPRRRGSCGGSHPADQDAMAAALYDQQGSAPWGGGC